MPERERDSRAEYAKLRRGYVETNLMIARILDYYGLPRVSKEEIDEVLIEEDRIRSVKSVTVAASQLSTGGSTVHRRPHTALPTRREEPR